MSFAGDVKNEIIVNKPKNSCCLHAQAYGMLLFCRSFKTERISVMTENKAAAYYYAEIISDILGKSFVPEISDAGKCSLKLTDKNDTDRILEHFGHSPEDTFFNINRANISDDCCFGAFISGVFIACGTVTNPQKDYHLEFVTQYKKITDEFKALLCEIGFEPKTVKRNGVYVIYFKDSESIEDILVLTGATNSSLGIMEAKIYKDVRNNVNRKVNFENANFSKTLNASALQIAAIKKIKKKKGLIYLPPELRSLAVLRLKYPEYSLRELGEELEEPISRSGANHRMNRIIKISEEM